MKRMLTVLVVLLLTAPVLAVPTISCVFDCNTHIATVSYSGVDSNNLIVALGLDITADGASITNVGGWNPSVDDYWVYPGSISIADGNVVGYGTPVAAAILRDSTHPVRQLRWVHCGTWARVIHPPRPAATSLRLPLTTTAHCMLRATPHAEASFSKTALSSPWTATATAKAAHHRSA